MRTWLDTSDVVAAVTLSVAQREKSVAAWELKEKYEHLGPIQPRILLPRDFPFSPLRVELDQSCCLRLPHVEASGNFCHGVLTLPDDLADPVKAAGRVLEQFLAYIPNSAEPEWIEQEFHREAHDYWLRHVDAFHHPKGCKTEELLLEIDADLHAPQRVETLHLGSRTRAIASSRDGGPKATAENTGWSLGTIVYGSTLVLRLPSDQRWTPNTWPRSFETIAALADELTGTTDGVKSWYASRQWSNDAPLFIVALQNSVGFGWRVIPSRSRASAQPTVVPVKVTRIDRRWTLARDHRTQQLDGLTGKRVVVFGCGSVGAPVAELLARAGVGSIDIVDPDVMKTENISRHPLGLPANGRHKATAFCERLKSSTPGVKTAAHTMTAQAWLAGDHPIPDLIVDCTGDRAVRMAIFHARPTMFGLVSTIMAWMEPFGAAAHVITVVGDDRWPTSDPAETAIQIGDWPDEVEVLHPGCGQGFHPYGMSDAWEAAAMAARRGLALLRGENTTSDVLSLVQSREYFERVWPGITFRRQLAIPAGITSVVERRTLAEALHGF
ncbi:MAG: ThiF family adenylyltransferase [Bryobacteraceae bacterium]|nr:ThiF family adenylyltransferase [Bryobacteraceae bacterium]